MNTEEVRRKVETEYNESMSSDKRIAAIAKKKKMSYADASAYASRAGRHMGEALADSIAEDAEEVVITEEEAKALIPAALLLNYRNVVAIARAAQEAMNEDAAIGLAALVPEFDQRRAAEIAAETAQAFAPQLLIGSCENASRKVVDDSMKVNARAHSSAGLRVTVTRIYDGVGLSGGRACKWCLDRCGTDMSYREAYDKGAFERHPGCGCELIYKTSKRVQRQSEWQHNKWEDVSEAQLRVRKEYGLE